MGNSQKREKQSDKQITHWENILISSRQKAYRRSYSNSIRLYRLVLVLAGLIIVIIGIGGILK